MLPELERGIAKPLKKRYRDLFEDDGSPQSDLPNASSNTIETSEYTEADLHIPATEENYQLLQRPASLYRKSVITRSIKEHISIIDIEQMTPKLADSADAPMRQEDEAKFQLETDENQTSHFVYLSDEYLINSPEVQFVGKLKVKWREKYENYDHTADINGMNSHERSTNVFDNLNGYGCAKNVEKNRPTGGYSSKKCRKEPIPQTTRVKVDTDAEDKISDNEKVANRSEEVPVVRKLERARKGLIYQKYMADTYSWTKKEKTSSTKNIEVPQQPRKRGRPRINPEGAKRPQKTEFNISESTVTVVRLERKKNSNTLKYAVVKSKNSKKSYVEKKT